MFNNIATRLLTDLSVITSSVTIEQNERRSIGFISSPEVEEHKLNFDTIIQIFKNHPFMK